MHTPTTPQTHAPPAPAGGRGLFEPGRNCSLVAHAPRATVLIDAEAYFRAFVQAALRATRSIVILGWDFDSRVRLVFDEGDRGAPPLLGDFLNFLVQRRRSLHVHILNWDYPMVFGIDRETRPLYGIGWKPRRRVHLHYDNTHPVGASHHQKIVVIDDLFAFSGGLDLTHQRWDTCAHRALEERRVFDGAPYPPFHDAMVAVDGDAARALADVTRERWRLATGGKLPSVSTADDPWPPELEPTFTDCRVAISRTVPKTAFTEPVREVEELYVDMIAAARRYIYIENQYFTSDRIGAALVKRLSEPDPPEVAVVSRLLSHGWLEEHTMHVLRTRLVKQCREADTNGRFEIYYPYVPELAEGTCVDLHDKLMVVDDEWLRVGSANLSNRSMGLDTECDLTFAAEGDSAKREAFRGVRDGLLAEHLGVEVEQVRAAVEREGSLHGAIRKLQCDGRTLKALEDLPQWSETVITLAAVGDPEKPVALEELIGQFSPDTGVHRHAPAWGKIVLIAVIVLALAAAWRYTPLSEWITAERVGDWAESFGGVTWAPLAVMLFYTPAAFLMFPRPLITLFAVIAFGPVLGFVYSMIGIVGAALATYYAGVALPRDTVRHLAGERLNRMSEILRTRGLLAVFAVRIVPVAPFSIEGMVAGAVRIKLWHYTLGTVLGMLPGTLTTSVFGDQLKTALEDPSKINYALVAGVVIFFVVLTLLVRRWFIGIRDSHHPAPAHHSGQPAA